MTTEAIREKLLDFNHRFKSMQGNLKGLEIVFDYVNFLESEPYIKNLIKPLFEYVKRQINFIEELETSSLQNITLDLNKPESFLESPVFNRETKSWYKHLKNKTEPNVMEGLAVNLTTLVLASSFINEIKERQQSGDIKGAQEIIETIKDQPMTVFNINEYVKGVDPLKRTYGQTLDISMELVNKFIIDQIDAESLLSNKKPEIPIHFDKDKSFLYIRGQRVKIARRETKSIDHYILECIFSQEDIFNPVDFSEISNNFLKKEYDTNNGWNTFRHACDKLNRKIEEETNLKDFIKYSASKLGWCKINKKYQ